MTVSELWPPIVYLAAILESPSASVVAKNASKTGGNTWRAIARNVIVNTSKEESNAQAHVRRMGLSALTFRHCQSEESAGPDGWSNGQSPPPATCRRRSLLRRNARSTSRIG